MSLGPISSFGLLVALGYFVGSRAGFRHAERLGLELRHARALAWWCAIVGLVGAHLVDVFLYQPGWSEKDGALLTLLNPFAGISSYGGLLGAAAGFLIYTRRKEVDVLAYADATAWGVFILLAFGRAGCASVHDHVGIPSEFALAVDFPPGNPTGVVGPHHDLGLYELGFLIALLTLVAALIRRPRRPGLVAAVLMVCYAVPRFFAEFLRRDLLDPRYAGLTPAQWISILTFAVGAGLLWWLAVRGAPALSHYKTPTSWRRYLAELLSPRAKAVGVGS